MNEWTSEKQVFLSLRELNILKIHIFTYHSFHIPLLKCFIKSFHVTDGETETWITKFSCPESCRSQQTNLNIYDSSFTKPHLYRIKRTLIWIYHQSNLTVLMPICRLASLICGKNQKKSDHYIPTIRPTYFCILLAFTEKKNPHNIYLDQDGFNLQNCSLEGNNHSISQWVCPLPVTNK